MTALQGQTVLVLGLGHSGLAMARWCAAQGASVRAWDSRESPPQAEAFRAALPQAPVLGPAPLDAGALDGVHRVLKSPGLAPHDAAVAPLLQAARERGTVVQGELGLFVEALADLRAERGYAPKLLAVTGTNGKTTTTALAATLVERSGRRAVGAGNIGPTLLDTLASALDAPDALPEVWVLELSSFQLDGVTGFEPDAAVVLNVTQDHLDWHGSMEAYAAAKARIFGPDHSGTLMVINRDDPRVRSMVPQPPPTDGARRTKAPKFVPRRVCSFGLGAPALPGDFGLIEQSGITWLARALPLDEGSRPRRTGEPPEVHLQALMPADALRIRGRHNAANALAALALATAIGCPLAPMLHALREYRGEPHRGESVAVVGGIEAFDDSKGTNVGATVAALEGLGAEKAPGRLAVILGGDGKGQDFSPLAAPVARFARAVALIGRDAPAIEAVLAGADLPDVRDLPNLPITRHDTLEAATAWCFAAARPGDAVLLSPACASLDMFRNRSEEH